MLLPRNKQGRGIRSDPAERSSITARMPHEAIAPVKDSKSIDIGLIERNPRVSEDTITDAEVQRENARQGNPNGFTDPVRGVSVEAAQEDFVQLQRELSGISEKSQRGRRRSVTSRHSTTNKETDIEHKAVSESVSEEAQFDL